jgi:hypothetical protein
MGMVLEKAEGGSWGAAPGGREVAVDEAAALDSSLLLLLAEEVLETIELGRRKLERGGAMVEDSEVSVEAKVLCRELAESGVVRGEGQTPSSPESYAPAELEPESSDT